MYEAGGSSFGNVPESSVESRKEYHRMEPGLTPIKTMKTAFEKVVDYQTHRLGYLGRGVTRRESVEMFHLKQNIAGLYPSFEALYGRKPIRLLSFLTFF